MTRQWTQKLLSAGLLLVACLSITSSALARGVDSSGGGNVRPPRPITLDDIKLEVVLLESSIPSEELLNFFFDFKGEPYRRAHWGEAISNPDVEPFAGTQANWDKAVENASPEQYAIIQKLFPSNGARNIIEAARTAHYHIEVNGPCYYKGEPKDGSADVSKNEICLSAPLLMARVNYRDLHEQLFALASHELSHLVGTSEPEAELVQSEYLNLARIPYEITGSKLNEVLVRTRQTLEKITVLAGAKKASGQKLCIAVAQAYGGLTSTLSPTWPELPVFFLNGTRLERQMEAMAIWSKVRMLQTACLGVSDPDRTLLVMPFDPGQTEMSLATYNVRTYKHLTTNPANGMLAPPATPFGETIHALAPGDRKGLLKETKELLARIEALHGAIYNDFYQR